MSPRNVISCIAAGAALILCCTGLLSCADDDENARVARQRAGGIISTAVDGIKIAEAIGRMGRFTAHAARGTLH